MRWPNGTRNKPTVSSEFGKRTSPIPGATRNHKGTDFTGFTAVKSIAEGEVTHVGTPPGWSGGGTQVWIQHDGYLSRYLHLKVESHAVRVGQKVAEGQLLGTMGMTGTASGVHCHLEIVVDHVQVDPVAFISARLTDRGDSLGARPRPPRGSRPTLRRGARGAAVTRLQRTLKAHYPLYASTLVVDGVFGPITLRVVKEFQRRAGLAVDGVVGPRTWAKLGL